MRRELPILLIGYNRPEMISLAIKNLKKIQPEKIYIALDGPKSDNQADFEKVEECKKRIAEIDWRCEVSLKFSEINQGCGLGVSAAITWALKNEEQILILEDDVEINPSFYFIAKELLNEFKDKKEIFAICASNISSILAENYKSDYFATKYFSGWGWATWNDRWSQYDLDVLKNNKVRFIKLAKYVNFNPVIFVYFYYNFKKIQKQKLDTWDYQINYHFIKKNLSALKTSKNLSRNLGIGLEATHTKKLPKYEYYDVSIDEIIHPPDLRVNKSRDRQHRKQLTRNLIKRALDH